MKVKVQSGEWYAVYSAEVDPAGTVEVDQETLARWGDAEAAFMQAQQEIRNLVDPPCPECGHHEVRHQEWSKEWDDWGCLAWLTNKAGEPVKKCRCRYGCPPERLKELEERERR